MGHFGQLGAEERSCKHFCYIVLSKVHCVVLGKSFLQEDKKFHQLIYFYFHIPMQSE